MKTNKQYKVLTPNGYMGFKGVRKLHKPILKFITENNQIRVTHDHPFVVDGKIIIAKNFKIEDYLELKNNKKEKIKEIINDGNEDVYDLMNVDGGSTYFANDFHVHNCFLQEGESALNGDDYEKYKSSCSSPLFIFDEGKYKIWEQPMKNGVYVAGVDVAEGVGQASSVVQIFDLADLSAIRQVACFRDNTITPYNFTTKLLEILGQWGNPPLLIERNNCGAQVVDALFENYNYDPIISYSHGKTFEKPGIFTNTNTKYQAVINMRYWINELRAIVFRDMTTLDELKNFTRYPNGTWAARKGANNFDDCVMSMAMALLILNDELVEKYFEVTGRDTNNRPSSITPFKRNENITYQFGGREDQMPSMPVMFSNSDRDERDVEMEYLEKEGWKVL